MHILKQLLDCFISKVFAYIFAYLLYLICSSKWERVWLMYGSFISLTEKWVNLNYCSFISPNENSGRQSRLKRASREISLNAQLLLMYHSGSMLRALKKQSGRSHLLLLKCFRSSKWETRTVAHKRQMR